MIDSGEFRAVKEYLNPGYSVVHVKRCPELILEKFERSIMMKTIQPKKLETPVIKIFIANISGS